MQIGSENLFFLGLGLGIGLLGGYTFHFVMERRKEPARDRRGGYSRTEWKRSARLYLILILVCVMAGGVIAFFFENGTPAYQELERSTARAIIEEKTGKRLDDAEIDRLIHEFRDREGAEGADRFIREYLDGDRSSQ